MQRLSPFERTLWQHRSDKMIEAMMGTSPSDVIGYNALSEIAGEPVTGCDWPVRRALKKALANGASFTAIPGVGYRRDTDTSGLKRAQRESLFGMRKIKKSRRHADTVNAKNLTSGERLAFYGLEAKNDAALSGLRKRHKAKVAERASLLDCVESELRGSR